LSHRRYSQARVLFVFMWCLERHCFPCWSTWSLCLCVYVCTRDCVCIQWESIQLHYWLDL